MAECVTRCGRHLSSLQVHHIFPKALLYKHGYKRQQVNAIANFTFFTQETNLLVSKRDPVKRGRTVKRGRDPEQTADYGRAR